MKQLRWCLGLLVFSIGISSGAVELQIGQAAPIFKGKNQSGADFDLASRRGQWTVLYFYPKAETPGCTKQACAFRDRIEQIREQGAEVYGISVNSVADQKAFHANHHLNFDLIADENARITESFGVKMPVVKMAKRWTFIVGPDLKIKAVEKDVDPAGDAERVAEILKKLKS